jgi:hypothetical protein
MSFQHPWVQDSRALDIRERGTGHLVIDQNGRIITLENAALYRGIHGNYFKPLSYMGLRKVGEYPSEYTCNIL